MDDTERTALVRVAFTALILLDRLDESPVEGFTHERDALRAALETALDYTSPRQQRIEEMQGVVDKILQGDTIIVRIGKGTKLHPARMHPHYGMFITCRCPNARNGYAQITWQGIGQPNCRA